MKWWYSTTSRGANNSALPPPIKFKFVPASSDSERDVNAHRADVCIRRRDVSSGSSGNATPEHLSRHGSAARGQRRA